MKKKPHDKGVSPKKGTEIQKKDLILTFVVFFVIFGFIGYLRGRSIRNKPERLRFDVLARLEIGERNGKAILAYQCNGLREVTWDIDTDVLFTERASVGTEEYTFYPAIIQDDSLTTAFLTGGGVASVFTAKEVFAYAIASKPGSTFTKEAHVKLVLTALLAAVTGYEIGYQIALHSNSDCTDPRFTPILHDAKNWTGNAQDWLGFEKTEWIVSLHVLEKETHPGFCKSSDANLRASEDNKFALARAEFLQLREGSATSMDHNLRSADFEGLKKYRNALLEYNQHCGN